MSPLHRFHAVVMQALLLWNGVIFSVLVVAFAAALVSNYHRVGAAAVKWAELVTTARHAASALVSCCCHAGAAAVEWANLCTSHNSLQLYLAQPGCSAECFDGSIPKSCPDEVAFQARCAGAVASHEHLALVPDLAWSCGECTTSLPLQPHVAPAQ